MSKILIFSREFLPDIGGAGVVAYEYAKALSSTGYVVDVLTEDKGGDFSFNEEVFFNIKVSKFKLYRKLWFLGFLGVVDFESYDLIILNDLSAVVWGGNFLKSSDLKKSIVMLHGSEIDNIYKKRNLFRQIFGYRRAYERALIKCKGILSVSDFLAKKFMNEIPVNGLYNKFKTVYSFVDCNVFFPARTSSFRANYGLPQDAVLLCSASRLVKRKGYLRMLRLFVSAVKKYPEQNLYWVIAGDGPYKYEFQEIVNDSGVSERIKFAGRVPRNELNTFYSNSDLFWLLSEYDEAFGLVYLEAAACGCPSLGSIGTGVSEAIHAGVSGFIERGDDDVYSYLDISTIKELKQSDIISFAKKFGQNQFLSVIEKSL